MFKNATNCACIYTQGFHICSPRMEKQWEKTCNENQNTEPLGPTLPLAMWPWTSHLMLLSLVPSSEKLCVRLDNLEVSSPKDLDIIVNLPNSRFYNGEVLTPQAFYKSVQNLTGESCPQKCSTKIHCYFKTSVDTFY